MTKSSLHFVYFQEISQNPELFVGGASRFDVKQGELGKFQYIVFLMLKRKYFHTNLKASF